MLNHMGLGLVFTAKDLASSKMNHLERRFSSLDEKVSSSTRRMSHSFRELSHGLGFFTVGAVSTFGSFALANAAGTFEQAVASVGAVANATTKELALLKSAAIEAGVATQYSPTEAAAGLRELAQAGFKVHESISLLQPVLDLAAGSLGDLTPQAAAGLAAQSMKAFGISLDQAAVSVDRMLKSANEFSITAADLPLALGTASRGAITLNQSLSETLITLGFVKNVIPSVERASTAVAVSMERLASPEVQRKLQGIGVSVVNTEGQFRSFLDVLLDLAPALNRMTAAQKGAFLSKTFGSEALAGINVMLTQLTNGIRTNTGEVLKGAKAIEHYRTSFANAGGTAAKFREQLLNTFAGQKQLLRGSLETLAIAIGEPFSQALKPVVTAIVGMLNVIINVVRSIPSSVKKAFATLFLAGSALLAFLGVVMLAKAGLGLLSIGVKALSLSLSGLMVSLGPAMLILSGLAAVVAGFVIAFKRNLGGIADFTKQLGERISLFFGGLKQLFEQGGFSGAVQKELARVENLGLKRFLISIWQIVYRINQIWRGFKQGFVAAIEFARPIFEELRRAFSEIAHTIGALFSELIRAAGNLPTSAFVSFGQMVGAALGIVVGSITKLIAIIAQFTGGVLSGFRTMLEAIRPAFQTLHNAFQSVIRAWRALFSTAEETTSAVNQSMISWRSFGQVLGKFVGGAVTVLAYALSGLLKILEGIIKALTFIKSMFVVTGTAIGETVAKLYLWFTEDLPTAIRFGVASVKGFFTSTHGILKTLGDKISGFFSSIAMGIKSFFQPVVTFFRSIVEAIQRVLNSMYDALIRVLRRVPDAFLPKSLERMKRQPLSYERQHAIEPLASRNMTPLHPSRAAMPATSTVQSSSDTMAWLERKMATIAAEQKQKAQAQAQTPITINLKVDSETLARVTHTAEQDLAIRSFSSIPMY